MGAYLNPVSGALMMLAVLPPPSYLGIKFSIESGWGFAILNLMVLMRRTRKIDKQINNSKENRP